MIFFTVGTQLPFDRMVKLVDEWAGQNPKVEILAQIANADYQPQNMHYVDFLDPKEYEKTFSNADVVLAHAAMGTVISSLMASKPVIVYPRKASLGEHRNEHQLATCNKINKLDGCYVTFDPEDLFKTLDGLKNLHGGSLEPYANSDLLSNINQFIVNAA